MFGSFPPSPLIGLRLESLLGHGSRHCYGIITLIDLGLVRMRVYNPLMTEPSWHRRESESSPAFSAFSCYCQLEQRSLSKVARECAKHPTLIRRWSSKHAWVARAAEYDTNVAEKAVAALVHGRKVLAERQLRLCRLATERAMKTLEGKQRLTAQQGISLVNAVAVLTRTLGLETESMGSPQQVIVRIHRNVSRQEIHAGFAETNEGDDGPRN